MSTCSTYGLTLDQTADQLARHLELETILISPVKINRQDWDMGLPQKTSLTTPKSNEGKILDFWTSKEFSERLISFYFLK